MMNLKIYIQDVNYSLQPATFYRSSSLYIKNIDKKELIAEWLWDLSL
jgi:hypothetical protein